MTSDVAFELRSQDLLQLARRRGRRGAWLFGFSIFGLLFGTFWMFWGVIVFLTGVGLVNGVIVFLFGGVGPTLGASLVAWAGVRRRRDAEELEQLAILAETRGDVTLGEAAHLLSESEAHAAKLLNVASSAGAARMVQSSALRAPLPLGPERQNLSAFRKARRRRALLLGVGGGSLVRALRAADRALHVIGVERRAAVIDAAHAYFGLPDDRHVRIVCDDADRFLAACDQQFDLLFADLYMADGMCPRQVAPDFLLHCRSRLAGNGVLVANQWSSEFAGNRAALVALNEVFDGRVVNLHAQGGNILSFAFHDALPDLHRDAWFDAAQALGLKLSIPLQRHARNLWRQNAEVLRSGRFRRLPR